MCNKDMFTYRGYILYMRSNTALGIIYNRMSHMPIIRKEKKPCKTITTKNQFKL